MRVSRSMLLGFVIVVVWAGFSEAKEETQPVPVIVVDMPSYNFNQVSQGDVVKHDFRVFNRGAATLEIKKVKPT